VPPFCWKQLHLNVLVIRILVAESAVGVMVNSLGECGSFWLETPVAQSKNVYIHLIIS
jgi:hypothetical protein